MKKPAESLVVVHGWHLFAHPLFLEQFDILESQVKKLSREEPVNYKSKNPTKRLAAITKLIFDIIPQDPTRNEYRQGKTLGQKHKHWFRAKFFQQYRLFFRYHQESKIIVYAWVNDEKTKRAYGRKSDAYYCFQKMLEEGNPPSNWDGLYQKAKQCTEAFKTISS